MTNSLKKLESSLPINWLIDLVVEGSFSIEEKQNLYHNYTETKKASLLNAFKKPLEILHQFYIKRLDSRKSFPFLQEPGTITSIRSYLKLPEGNIANLEEACAFALEEEDTAFELLSEHIED